MITLALRFEVGTEYLSPKPTADVERISIEMTQPLPTLRALATESSGTEGYLLDLDGTLISGAALLPGVRDFLQNLRQPFVILSNDSEHVPEQIVDIFQKEGIALKASQVVLAGVIALEEIARRTPGARVMLLASPALRDLAARLGLRLSADRPEVVVLARDRSFDFDKLTAAARALRLGAKLVLACPDTTHPSPNGEIVPEVGALAAAIFACVGNIEHEVIGKPEPSLFNIGCERLGMTPAQCLMIGDNLLTDGVGATRAGIAFRQIDGIGEEIVVAD